MLKMIEVTKRLQRVRAVILDSDGVIFTGHVIEGQSGPLAKIRCHADGQGISLLRAAGICILCVTGESGVHASFLLNLIKKWNEMPSAQNGDWETVSAYTGAARDEKVHAAKEWLRLKGLSFSNCAVMGDDITDYDLLLYARKYGFAAAPAQAEDFIKQIVHWAASRKGGNGAIRDLANVILAAQGVDIATLCVR